MSVSILLKRNRTKRNNEVLQSIKTYFVTLIIYDVINAKYVNSVQYL